MNKPKVVLITGASAENGVAMVELLLSASCRVFAQVHTNKAALAHIRDKNLEILSCDLSDEISSAGAYKKCCTTCGPNRCVDKSYWAF